MENYPWADLIGQKVFGLILIVIGVTMCVTATIMWALS